MDGILIVDKPAGMTSHDVVARVRSVTGQKRIGHAGTLDPAATGVLVVLLGRATKLSQLFTESDKTYEGTIVLGAETDTADGDGKIISERDASGLDISDIKTAVKRLTGEIDQVPPAYSAVKIAGRPAYKLARQGKAQLDIEARRVNVYEFDINSFTPGSRAEARCSVRCSKGTYIRSLASDLGKDLGVGGYLKELRRTTAGAFGISDAVCLDAITPDVVGSLSKKISDGLSGTPKITVNQEEAARIMNGFGLMSAGSDMAPGTRIAVIDEAGMVLAIHESTEQGGTKPVRIIGEGRL